MRSDMLVSASIEAEIVPDGTPQTIAGRSSPRAARSAIRTIPTAAAFRSAAPSSARLGRRAAHACACRSRSTSGAARITLRAEFAAPRDAGRQLAFRGRRRLDRARSAERRTTNGMVLKRVVVRGQIDPVKQRVIARPGRLRHQGARRHADVRTSRFALSGIVDYGHRAAARARHRRQSDDGRGDQADVAALRRAEGARLGDRASRQRHGRAARDRDQRAARRVAARRSAGARRRAVGRDRRQQRHAASGRRACRRSATPTSTARITGRTATVTLGQGIVDVSPGRRLAVTNGVFEVPDIASEGAAGARAASASKARCRPRPNCSRWSGCASSPARRSIRRPRAARSARRSSSACRCGPICRAARPPTTSPSISRISPPRRW